MRVLPNRYPAFVGDESMAVRNLGPVRVMAEASGVHEVFVFTPSHDGNISQLSDDSIAEFMQMLKNRLIAHKNTSNIR